MKTHTNERRTDNSTSPAQRSNIRNRPCTYEQPALDDIPLNPKRSGYVLQLILKQHNWRHSSKDKGVSNKTIAERSRLCFWLFDFLRGHLKHFKLDPRSFSGRHVEAVTQQWQGEARAGRMSPASIQTYFSFMKTFTGWIGKPKLLKPIAGNFDDPKLYRRTLASGIDKSWRAKCVDADPVISVAFYLDTNRGTKGGRERYFPIDNSMRQDAIEYARRVAVGVNESVSDQRKMLKRAIRRLRYGMERFGLTQAGLGVVPYGYATRVQPMPTSR